MKTSRSFARLLTATLLALILGAVSVPMSSIGAPLVRQAAGAPRAFSDAALGGAFLAHADPSMRLHVALFLKGAHEGEIPSLQMQQADPRSPLFRHWLTAQQYGNYFGATAEQVRQTVAYLRNHGFSPSLIAPNNRYIAADAPVAAVEAAFATPIEFRQTPNGQRFYANRFAPAVQGALPWVQAVTGLDSYHVVHSHAIVLNNSSGLTPTPQATVLGPGKFAFGAQDLYTAYDFNRTYTGSGMSIAIPVVRNFLPSDTQTYSTQFGISLPKYVRTFLNGTCATPCPRPTSAADAGETALDTELSHAAAPDATLIVVSQGDGLQPSQALNYQYIANVLGSSVQAVTSSYGICESLADPASRMVETAAIDQGTLEGETWFSASGDDGADDCKNGLKDIDFPSGVPSLVAVGGTTLNTTIFQGNVQSYNNEYAWNDSGCHLANGGGATGGGASHFFPKPTWQSAKTPNDKVRDVPDVAAEADPYQQTTYPADCPTGGGYWVLLDNIWSQIGGTSGASPFWAGILADLAQEQRGNLGLILPSLYKLKGNKAYHQITIGDNSFKGVNGYTAKTGYSQVTGLGSPDESKFLAAFSETRPPTPKPTAFPALVPHPGKTPVGAPTARAFIPVVVSSPAAQIAVFNATVGANQGKQVQIITSKGFPIGIASSPTGNAVFALEFGGGIDKITTNVTPYKFQAVAYLTGAFRAGGIAVASNSAYVSDSINGQVDQVNLTTSVSTPISVGHGPTGVTTNPKAAALYVANTGDGTVSVINTTTNKVVQTFKAGDKPVQVGVNSTGKLGYVVNSGNGTITPVTLGTKAGPGVPVYVGGEPTSIAINPGGTLAFVTNVFCPQTSSICEPGGPTGGQEQLGVVEVLTLNTKPIGVECCIIVGQQPTSAAFEPTGHYVWVVNGGNNSASIIDSFTNTVVQTVTTTPATSFWESSGSFVQLTPK